MDSRDVAWRAGPSSMRPAGVVVPYNLRFPGQYYEAETGLNQNWNRDYDPFTGKYVGSDLIGLKGGTNTYVYAHNIPVSLADPSGLVTTVAARCVPVFGQMVHCAIVARCSITGDAMRFEIGGPEGASQWQALVGGLIPPKFATPNPSATPGREPGHPETDYPVTCDEACGCGAFNCLKDAFAAAPAPPYYAAFQNSNTFAHSLLNKCNCSVDPYLLNSMNKAQLYGTAPEDALGW